MTANDELLTLLKEHGVEHYEHEAPATDCIAFFDGNGWHDCWESTGGEVNVTFSMTPEQAIAATLGSCNCSDNCTNGERTETCHDKNGFDVTFGFECTVCGAMTDGYMLSPADTGHYKQFNFCPMCGRRIEQ